MPFCRRLPRSLDGVAAGGLYEGLLRDVILRMKHRSSIPLSQAMAQVFASRLGQTVAAWQPSFLVPVPMHWCRRWIRGINSPEILAQRLGNALAVPVRQRLVVRARHTRLQTELSPTARKTNIQEAFRLRDAPKAVQGARIILVDDVLTTGATCGELAKLLKQAGASAVWAAVLARTPPRGSL